MLVATATGDLSRFDRTTGQSVAIAGEVLAARMTPDGRHVAFESRATNLVEGFEDRNFSAPSLFVRDLSTGTTRLVDGHEGSATASSGDAELPVRLRGLSNDGTTVLFTSAATDVVSLFSDRNGAAHADVYRRDVTQTAAQLVSFFRGSAVTGTDGPVGNAAMSADGRAVVFAADDHPFSSSRDENGDGTDVYLRRYPLVDKGEDPEQVTFGSDEEEPATTRATSSESPPTAARR